MADEERRPDEAASGPDPTAAGPERADSPPAERGTEAAPEAAPTEREAPEPAPAQADAGAAEPEPSPDAPPAAQRPPSRRRERGREEEAQSDVVPGAHLEPDLVLEGERAPSGVSDPYASYAEGEGDATAEAEPPTATPEPRPAPVRSGPIELAAGARYQATGKRKTSVARVILKPGTGVYSVNGRTLEDFFPRPALLKRARVPLELTGNATRMDVVARIHGGGVSAQAGALRHGVARALVEADPNLRGELKRSGLLTRDARVKERKKAGLKKARKRPQFSKR